MNRTISTSTRDLREHRSGERLEELVQDAEPERADDRAGKLPDAAEHDRHERVDDVRLPEVRTDVPDLRQRDTAEPRDAGAEAERKRVDLRGAHAHAAGHRAVLRDGADEQAEARHVQHRPNERDDGQRERDDVDAVPRQDQVRQQLDAAAHPRGVRHFDVLRAEQRSRRLDQQQAQAVGREQRLERPAVEETHDGALDDDADDERARKRRGKRGGEIPVERARRILPECVLHDERRVRADHQELAVRHVDDAHQPVGDREAQCREQQHAAEADPGEHGAGELAFALAAVDRADRTLRGGAQLSVGLAERAVRVLLDERQQQQSRRRVVACRKLRDRLELARPVARSQAGAQRARAQAAPSGPARFPSRRPPRRAARARDRRPCSSAATDRVRTPTSAESRSNAASAPSRRPRIRLLIVTASSDATSGDAFAPVSASTYPSPCAITRLPSGSADSASSRIAFRMIAARGSPLATSRSIPASFSLADSSASGFRSSADRAPYARALANASQSAATQCAIRSVSIVSGRAHRNRRDRRTPSSPPRRRGPSVFRCRRVRM